MVAELNASAMRPKLGGTDPTPQSHGAFDVSADDVRD